MRLPERVSGASIGLEPPVDGDMRLPPADVAASSGEQNAHSGRRIQAPRKQPHRTTTQSPDRKVKLAIAPIPAFHRDTLVLNPGHILTAWMVGQMSHHCPD